MKTLRNKNKSGFTLIELLVVIAIIGLLASVVLLALNSARAKARDAKRLADIRQLASGMELFFNDINSYPTITANYGFSTAGGQDAMGGAAKPNLVPNYIGLLPTPPLPADGTCSSATNGSTYYMYKNYSIAADALTNTYLITFCLGADTGGYKAGMHTLTPAGIQ